MSLKLEPVSITRSKYSYTDIYECPWCGTDVDVVITVSMNNRRAPKAVRMTCARSSATQSPEHRCVDPSGRRR